MPPIVRIIPRILPLCLKRVGGRAHGNAGLSWSLLNQTIEDWFTDHVTLSVAKGLDDQMLCGVQHDRQEGRDQRRVLRACGSI
jgi:hypothetical protein